MFDAQMLPPLHAASVAHMHVPDTHASPAAQHVEPQVGPVVHVPDGMQLRPSRWTAASPMTALRLEHPHSDTRMIRARMPFT